MGSAPRIAIDAMGGDVGPAVMVAGAALAHKRRSDISLLLFGDEGAIRAELAKVPELAAVSQIVHSSDVIAAVDKPSQAIRRAKTTSMGQAIAAGSAPVMMCRRRRAQTVWSQGAARCCGWRS